MMCAKCEQDLVDCQCEGKEQRVIEGIVNNPNMVYKGCRKCGKHYVLCKCERPEWVVMGQGNEIPSLLHYLDDSFTCPQCHRISYNPSDIRNQYCGACHTFFK